MMTALLEKSNPVEASARSFLKLVFGRLSRRAFAVQLWNGEQWAPEPKENSDSMSDCVGDHLVDTSAQSIFGPFQQ